MDGEIVGKFGLETLNARGENVVQRMSSQQTNPGFKNTKGEYGHVVPQKEKHKTT